MIIKFPTGYYSTVLPHSDSDPGNVTFTCSTSLPPRSTLAFTQLSPAVAGQIRSVLTLGPDSARRASRAAMTHSSARSSGGLPGVGAKRYEPGQILEFTDQIQDQTAPPAAVSTIEIRHDTNLLDLGALGLSTQDNDLLTVTAATAYASLVTALSIKIQERANIETQLDDAQKRINEATKATAAVQAILKIAPSPDIAVAGVKLATALVLFQATKQQLVIAAAAADVAAQELRDEILSISQLVR